MFRSFIILCLILLGVPTGAETVLANRNIRTNSVITLDDLALSLSVVPGSFSKLDQVIGLEAKAIIYAGRPVLPGDVGPPSIISRNQIVTLVYSTNGLRIYTEGRSLSRAGVGDRLRVMNLNSRTTVTGTVHEDGSVSVTPPTLNQ